MGSCAAAHKPGDTSRPCGFETVLFDGFLTEETVAQVRRVLTDAPYRNERVETNYRIATAFFGYEVIEDELHNMVRRPQNLYRLLARNKARRDMLDQLKNRSD